MDAKKFVFKVKDVPLWETADGEMRDQFMITDEVCGANDLTGGLYWMRPQYRGHEDVHTFDEAFYAISGRAQFVADDEPFDVEPGDVIFCPAGVKHRFDNPYDTPYHGFWIIGAKWSDLGSIQEEVESSWRQVDHDRGWHLGTGAASATGQPESPGAR